LIAQEREPGEEGKRESETPEGRQKVNDILLGVTPAKRVEIDEWLSSRPGMTTQDYFTYQAHVQALLKREEQVKKETYGLLRSKDAAGWSIEKAVSIPVYGPIDVRFPSESTVRVGYTAGRDGGYVLTNWFANSQDPKRRYENTITVDSSYERVLDLSRFFQVNNRLLKDMPLPLTSRNEVLVQKPFTNPALAHSDIVVITGAQSPDRKEIITVFDLADSAETGALHGSMVVLSSEANSNGVRDRRHLTSASGGGAPQVQSPQSSNKQNYFLPSAPLQQPESPAQFDLFPPPPPAKTNETLATIELSPPVKSPKHYGNLDLFPPSGTVLKHVLAKALGNSASKRVYYYGDDLRYVNLREIIEGSGHEFIQRSPNWSRNLLVTNTRLRLLEGRNFQKDKLTILNGLPRDSQTVMSMGALAGDANVWLDLRSKVEDTLDGYEVQRINSREAFIDELSQGESDIIILVAHSTGMNLYLNGEQMSIEEIKALPSRRIPSRRPRLAVLVSCKTGKPTAIELGWRRFFRKQIVPLAQILVEKGYVDKVIAPDHDIRGPESLIVLQRALDGARAATIFHGWVNWATIKVRSLEFTG
jgi:hypothetical protein